MNRIYINLLSEIYKNQTLTVREVIDRVERIHGDHRDFYPLVGLLDGKYIGTTLPLFDGKYNESLMAQQMQAISQGPGMQSYKNVQTMSDMDGSYFYIAGKGLDYFAARQSDIKKIIIATLLSLISGLVVAFAAEPVKKLWGNGISTPLIKLETRKN